MEIEFEKYILTRYPEKGYEAMKYFKKYLDLLINANRDVNLVSRKTSIDDIWNKHFFDSILAGECVDFQKQQILDFGSGGGLPGIPIKILFPATKMFLMDSKQKKTGFLDIFISDLNLVDCAAITSRLEETPAKWNNFFDIILCRSVKIIPKYRQHFHRLLSKNGRLILYKGNEPEEMRLFKRYKTYKLTNKSLGSRHIFEIDRGNIYE